VTWDIAKPTASATIPATLGSTHNAPLMYSFTAYQATDRRTRRTKPSELEVDFMSQAIAGEPGRSCTAFGGFAYVAAGQLPASSECEHLRHGQHPEHPDVCRGTALNNLYRASGGRVMGKVRSVPVLLITVVG
jgi:hypothetical protein